MENIGGIFVVLICGLIVAVFVAVMEFVWSTRRSAETDEVRPHCCPGRNHRNPPVGYYGNTPPGVQCSAVSVVLWCRRVDVYMAASKQRVMVDVCVSILLLFFSAL